jgi:hypothetical protein
MTDAEDRFWSRVRIGDGCWEWIGFKNKKGYGHFCRLRAHRAAWGYLRGEIPAGLCVLHKCDNRACVRPSHLFLGTRADNNADMRSKGREARGARHGSRTRPGSWARGARRASAKLDDDKVRAIRAACACGEMQRVVAERFGVAEITVWKILHRRTWTHVHEESGS